MAPIVAYRARRRRIGGYPERVDVIDLTRDGRLTPYDEAWELQRRVHSEVADGSRPDALILVEHDGVYTAGRRTASRERPTDGSAVVEVDRGGKITWHGPGQLVAYPIVRLAEPIDVVRYVRVLEGAIMDVCCEFGVETRRVDGRSGVWCLGLDGEPDRKICAIGVRVARGVTMHGLALNCDCDLAAFDRIVACGLDDAGVTSLSHESGRAVAVVDVAASVVAALGTHLASVTDPVDSCAVIR
jgi:lipoyl(octanoyl) transferase